MTEPVPTLSAATFEVLRHRLWAINDEAAVTIGRVSGSPIATEGNDFNAGLMTASGETVVAGVYVLVHAAALGRVVRDVLERYADNPGIGPGDMFITNDTYVGAPHQPDVIVVAPIFDGDRLVAWCGSCVHQADVGGPVPGSITVGARSIYDEALPMSPVRIVEAGRLRADIEREYLHRSRTPELNRLDLLGQIAANRVQTGRVLDLCARYGTEAVVGTFERLIDATERALRERLRALPDGRFRHVGFVEHDGVEDRVYEVHLTLTKRGDSLELDFTGSSDQAPALVNVAEPTLSGYSMAAVMTVLGFGLPWVPAAFWRVMDIRTRPGSVVHAVMPAGMSMGVTSAGQEARTAVNVCLSRLLDASDDPAMAAQVLASCTSSSATSTLSGRHDDGRPFGTMLLDGVLGGMGARAFADGPDTGGFLSSPSGAAVNVEVAEAAFPLRYLARRERTDSGGPGRYRGGVGAENVWVPHRSDGGFGTTVFAHGTEPPTASGVAGGEPGMQNGFGIERRTAPGGRADDPSAATRTAAKQVTSVGSDDVFWNWSAGGGGLGDPLDRPVDEVERDVADGLVGATGARRDYGVVVGDPAATEAERTARRRARLGGHDPRPARTDAPTGRRVSAAIEVDGGRWRCRRCGEDLGPADRPLKDGLAVHETGVADRWSSVATLAGAVRFVLRRWWCPGCAAQVDVEVARAHSAALASVEWLSR